MKHALIVATLLLTHASAFGATAVSSNFEDPNNKYSEMGQAQKKPCPFRNASGGDVANARLIRAVGTQVKPDFNARSRGTGQLI